MKNILKSISLLSFLTFTFNIVNISAATYSLGTRAFDSSDYATVGDIDSYNYDIEGATQVQGTITVNNLTYSDNSGGGHLLVSGLASGYNFEFKGNVIFQNNLNYNNITSEDTNSNIIVFGNLECYTIDIKGNLYVYGTVNCNNVTVGGKTKIIGQADGYNFEGRNLYTFGKKIIFNNLNQLGPREAGFFQKIDPHLHFALISSDITLIKSKISEASKKVESAKAKLSTAYKNKDYTTAQVHANEILDIKKEMLAWIYTYIEDTTFDNAKYKEIVTYEINTTNNFFKISYPNMKTSASSTVSLTKTDDSTTLTKTTTTSTQISTPCKKYTGYTTRIKPYLRSSISRTELAKVNSMIVELENAANKNGCN